MKFCTIFVNPGMNLLRDMLVEVQGSSKIVNNDSSIDMYIENNMKTSFES